jgi:membrane fusion protein (multidrug efflux system)
MKWQTLVPVAVTLALLAWALLLFVREDSVATVDYGPAPLPAVVTRPAVVQTLPYEIEAVGTALANESVAITATVTKLVSAIRFEEGELVEQDEVLIELDDTEVLAEVALARANLAESRSQFRRSEELFANRAVSEAEVEQLEARMQAEEARLAAAEARLEDAVVRAPFAGRVGLRRVSVGSLVTPGTVITTLDDTDPIKLEFAVPEAALAALRPGLEVAARSIAYPDAEFAGRVANVDSRVDPVSRSVTVRALIDNAAGLLKPGMFLTVRLVASRREAVLVPEQALVPEQDVQSVFVFSDGRVHKRQVQIGRRQAGTVEVLDGLAAGERVVIEGTQRLRDGVAANAVDHEGPRP